MPAQTISKMKAEEKKTEKAYPSSICEPQKKSVIRNLITIASLATTAVGVGGIVIGVGKRLFNKSSSSGAGGQEEVEDSVRKNVPKPTSSFNSQKFQAELDPDRDKKNQPIKDHPVYKQAYASNIILEDAAISAQNTKGRTIF